MIYLTLNPDIIILFIFWECNIEKWNTYWQGHVSQFPMCKNVTEFNGDECACLNHVNFGILEQFDCELQYRMKNGTNITKNFHTFFSEIVEDCDCNTYQSNSLYIPFFTDDPQHF